MRDNLHFLSLWLRRPAGLGAVIPSGRSLGTAMAEAVDVAAAGAVVELGGGTGNITAALLDAGVRSRDLTVVEREPSLARVITARFPDVRVVRGDARHLRALLRGAGIDRVKAIVSGLPLLSMPEWTRSAITHQALAALAPDGIFVQFTYGPAAPISRALAARLGVSGRRTGWVLDNLPPASVWSYRKHAALGAAS